MKTLTEYINEQVNNADELLEEGLFGFGKMKHGDLMKSIANAFSALNGAYYDIKKAAPGFEADVTIDVGFVINGEQKYGNSRFAEWSTNNNQPKLLIKYSGNNSEEYEVPVALATNANDEYEKDEKHKILALLAKLYNKAVMDAMKTVSEYKHSDEASESTKIRKACDLYVGFIDTLSKELINKPESLLDFGTPEKPLRDKVTKILEKYAKNHK